MDKPTPRRIPSSPSTPNFRTLSLSTSSGAFQEETTPTPTPLTRSPEILYGRISPTLYPKNGDPGPRSMAMRRESSTSSGGLARSRTMPRARNGDFNEFDEFGSRRNPSSVLVDEDETIGKSKSNRIVAARSHDHGAAIQPTTRTQSSRGLPLNLDTRDLESPLVPLDESGSPLPMSAPGVSVYSDPNTTPITPQNASFQHNHAFTPSPTKTKYEASQIRPTHRHHLQNHMADFLPADVSERMERWVQEVVVCNFDIDRGPIVERRMRGRPWGKGERANVAFSAFPDTSLFAEGSISYSFKIRQATSAVTPLPLDVSETESSGSYFPEEGSTILPTSQASSRAESTPVRASPAGTHNTANNGSCDSPTPLPRTPLPHHAKEGFFGPQTEAPETPLNKKVLPTQIQAAEDYRKWDERGREWLYGFVWFCQKKDRSVVRGYMQRSIVILTHLPLPSLFLAVLDKVAPMYFDHGYPALEALCYGFAGWPDPVPGAELQLPLLTDLLTVRLPDYNDETQLPSLAPLSASKQSPVPRPIVLASLPPVRPLRAFATFLPSLWHIWECMVLGEPLLVIAPDPQTCSTIIWWLRDIMRPIPTESVDFRPYLHIHDLDFRLLVNSNKPQPGVVVGVTNPFFRNAAGHWPNVVSVSGGSQKPKVSTGPNTIVDHPQGFLSARKRHISKDRPLLKRLEDLVAAGKLDDPAGNEALRALFIQLTEKMLSPLNRYVTSLIPPVGSPEGIKPFSLSAFLTHLKAMAPNPLQFRSKGLTSKGRVETEFYTAFCKNSGFATWLRRRIVSLTEAKWGPGQASRIPQPVLNLPAGYSQNPSGSPRRLSEMPNTRYSDDSSHRSSVSSMSWADTFSRRGSDGGLLGSSIPRRF